MKKLTSLFVIALLTIACKTETTQTHTPKISFADLLDNYYEDGLQLNPLNATMAGDNRYNDQFPDVLSPTHKAKAKAHFEHYQKALSAGQTHLKKIIFWVESLILSCF